MIVAVDGPSGSGKGTLSRSLSRHFHLFYLDTGLLYRAVALQLINQNIPFDDRDKAVQIAQSLTLDNLTEEQRLRHDHVAQGASVVAAYEDVRQALLDLQRSISQNIPDGSQGIIFDGRDIGTHVLPNANLKFYLTASVECRAKRRHQELQNRGIKSIYEDVIKNIQQRDGRDESRVASPARSAQDAIIIDTTDMSAESVFHHVALKISRALN